MAFISLSPAQCLCYQRNGDIFVLNTELKAVMHTSVFSLKNEDSRGVLLIKAREQILFTIQSNQMDLYSTSSFKKTDYWNYFLPFEMQGCTKNKDGSQILVWDSASNLTLYNLARQIPAFQKQMLPPGNRQRDAIQCIDTNGSQIITCG